MQRYLSDPNATAATIDRQGWLRTGDIGYAEQGKIYIVDRQKELIKVRGWQISPAELEAQLNCHPRVRESAVIGIPSLAMDTELPRAYVVRVREEGEEVEEGEELSERELKAYMSQHLARYKSLDGGVRFVDAIPKTSSGKIVRHLLRKMAEEEMAEEGGGWDGERRSVCDDGERRRMCGDDTKASHSIAGTDTPQTYITSTLPSPTSEIGGTTSSISECSSGEEADDEDDYPSLHHHRLSPNHHHTASSNRHCTDKELHDVANGAETCDNGIPNGVDTRLANGGDGSDGEDDNGDGGDWNDEQQHLDRESYIHAIGQAMVARLVTGKP